MDRILETINEDVNASDVTQEQEDDVLFNQDPLGNAHDYFYMIWRGLGKVWRYLMKSEHGESSNSQIR